jgi:hypothetical protein
MWPGLDPGAEGCRDVQLPSARARHHLAKFSLSVKFSGEGNQVRKVVLLAVGAICTPALLATGCGGGGDGDTVTVSSMSKSQYVKKADRVCEEGTKNSEVDFGVFLKEEQSVKNPTKADFVKLVGTVVAPNVEAEVEELRELGAPRGDVGKVEAMLKAREESIAIAEEDPEAVIQNSEKVFGKASRVAGEYGLKACATR